VLRRAPDAVAEAAFSLPRLSFYAGRWIRHGDWYPDRKVRLWKRGRGHWAGHDPHDRVEVDGPVGRFAGDLEHYSYDSLGHHLQKLQVYSDLYVQEGLARGHRPGWGALLVRPAWRFFRGYVIRLGFLDGWQGLAIAWMSAVLSFLKYAKLREALERPTA
jgi:hypothetical protein